MKKRMLKVLVSVALAASLLVGCGNTGVATDTQVNSGAAEGSSETDTTGTDTESETETEVVENPYKDFAIADVEGYVNVRKEPSAEAEAVGKIYNGAVAQIKETAGEQNDWFKIVSGNVEGYVKAEFFIYGDSDTVSQMISQYITKFAKVKADLLNVRADKSSESEKIGYLEKDEKVRVIEDCGEWLRIQYTSEKEGYIAAEFVEVTEDFSYGKTLEEERAELLAQQEKEEQQEDDNEDNDDNENKDDDDDDSVVDVDPPKDDYETNSELRTAIVDYAMQYLGHKYVHGGQSLKTGTDCSGFTMYVLLEFGIKIGRTPQQQFTSAGRGIKYSQAQPGDIICYSSNGGKSCTHVAFYIGNGKILHAANSRDGVKISSATYTDIYGVRNVID